MDQQRLFEQIVASLHEAMLDDALWVPTSVLIDEALESHGNHLSFILPPEPPVFSLPSEDHVPVLFMRFCYRGEHRTDLEDEYLRVYHPVDDHLPRLRQLPDSKIAHVIDTFSEEGLRKSRIYHEMMPRFQFQNGVNVRMDGPSGSRIIWGAADPVDSSAWSSRKTDLIARLLPHIRQFVRVRLALVEAGALATTLGALLENTRTGVIQLDRQAKVVAANDRAQAMLRKGDVLQDTDGALCATSTEDDRELQRLLGRALWQFGTQGASGSMVVRALGAPATMVVHVTPVSHRERDAWTMRAAALVLAVEPESPARIDRRVLQVTLGLTPAESDVAARLAEGHSVSEIADALGRTAHTVRWHVKQCYRKVGVSRQFDLIRVVQAVGRTLPPDR